jgi:hypothetical protein
MKFQNEKDYNIFIQTFKKQKVFEEKNIFNGVALDKIMERSNESNNLIPDIIYKMLKYLILHAPSQKGVFRENGPTEEITSLMNDLIFGDVDFKNYNFLTVTSLYKQFIRDLPDPLLTYTQYDKLMIWYDNYKNYEEEENVSILANIMMDIPVCNRMMMYYLFFLIFKISENKTENLMNYDNLAVVFSPNILKSKEVDFTKFQKAKSVFLKMIELYPKYLVDFVDYKNFCDNNKL